MHNEWHNSSRHSSVLLTIVFHDVVLCCAVLCSSHTFNFRLDRGIMFMCMCDESYGRSRPFQFIKEVQDTYFLMFTGEEEELSGSTLRSFKQVLASKMKVYSETTDNSNASSSNSLSSTATRDALFGSHSHSHNNSYDSSRSAYIPDKAHKVRAELDSVKGVIKDNLERVIARGESIESLVDRTESLNHNADAFRKASKKLKQNLCWANFKVKLLITLIVIVLLYCIAASYCGVTLSTCIG